MLPGTVNFATLSIKDGHMRRLHSCFLTALLVLSTAGRGQNLTNGDLAIVNFATASNGMVGLVALTNLPGSSVVNITVASWSNGFDAAAAYEWALPASGVPAGTFITVTNFNNALLSVSTGSISIGPQQMALSTNGDQILVFQTNTTDRWFIYGLNYNVAWITNGPIGPSASYLPPGLEGASLELLSATNGAYNRTLTNGTKAELLQAITNAFNWIRSSVPISSTNLHFTVQDPFVASASFATNADVATEGNPFTVQIQRNTSSDTGVVEVAISGSSDLGVDFEAYAITHIRDPSLGSGFLGYRLAAWGTNLFAASSEAGEFGGDVVLFNSEGITLGIITNPAPDVPAPDTPERFGSALVFLSESLLAVGCEGDNIVSNDVGGVYLYAWNGSNATLLATLSDPNPSRDYFGAALGRLSSNRFIVGAYYGDLGATDSGSAYIYDWNGTSATLLTSVTNPLSSASGDVFGRYIAVLQSNLFVISSEFEEVGAVVNAGMAHLFQWNGEAATLLTTITNPAPGTTDQFGHSVAMLSTNEFIIGADRDHMSPTITNAGRAFVYRWNGASAVLLATVTNPLAASEDHFGQSISALSTDRFVIGAWRRDATATNVGAAYLFDWNGASATLIATVTNPTPEANDLFGSAVLGVDAGRFMVAAFEDDVLTANDGSVTIYSWNGSVGVVTSVIHRTSADNDAFGVAMDGLVNGRFVIGANFDHGSGENSGAAHLYQWTGTSAELLATVTNPSDDNSSFFGSAVGGMGSDRFIVGAQFDDSEGPGNGRAYLYEWNGTNAVLLDTVVNPSPSNYAHFGSSVAGLGSSRFVVAAELADDGADDAGAVYLYSWNGTNAVVLATVTNPTPLANENFGSCLAGMGPFRFLVGAEYAQEGGIAGGCAYLYQWNGSTVSLLATVTNPAPQSGDRFGSSLSGMGISRFIIGAEYDSENGLFSGRAYLYDWNGSAATLLATVTNPSPNPGDLFGDAVAGISTGRFAVGATQETPYGVVHLYNWNGQSASLLTTITNPAPTSSTSYEDFGAALADVNEVGLLVGVPSDSDPAIASGSAWLYRGATSGGNLVVDFDDGQTSAYVHVFSIDDRNPEDDENITFTFANNLGLSPVGVTSTVVVVTDNDPWATALTRPFQVSPTTAAITWTDTVAGTSYQLEFTTNLLNTTWTTSTLFSATGTTHTVPFPFVTNDAFRAFRLVW